MKGVSGSAREAQTAAIYGGDLYMGVWPWAEVWKYDANRSDWIFVRRMFTHPEITADVNHPYQAETDALGEVYNIWGQRVTSMIPAGGSLYISTSAKNSRPYGPEFKFLSDDKWKDYGTVYRLTRPGNLSAYTEWKNEPTRFDFILYKDRMAISQNGKELGSTPMAPELTAEIKPNDIDWGMGVYGPFRGEIVKKTFEKK